MNREHTWESLYAGPLPAGTYTLKVTTRGDGKNSFALRTAAPFALETSDFSVNARDTEQTPLLAARLFITPDWVGKTLSLQNYDLDGPREAETWAVQPGGASWASAAVVMQAPALVPAITVCFGSLKFTASTSWPTSCASERCIAPAATTRTRRSWRPASARATTPSGVGVSASPVVTASARWRRSSAKASWS